MSLAGRKRRRHSEIKKRHQRRAKIAKLRAKFANAKTDGERAAIALKVRKVSPDVRLSK